MLYNPIQFQQGMLLPEFLQCFGTETACAEAVRRAHWPDGFVCPGCSGRAHRPTTTTSRNARSTTAHPVQALQAWQVSKLHLFNRAVYKQAGLDTYEQVVTATLINRLRTHPNLGVVCKDSISIRPESCELHHRRSPQKPSIHAGCRDYSGRTAQTSVFMRAAGDLQGRLSRRQ